MPLSKPVKKQQLILPSPRDFHQLPSEKKELILKRLSTDNLIIYLEYIVKSFHGPSQDESCTLEQIVEDDVRLTGGVADGEAYINEWINKNGNRGGGGGQGGGEPMETNFLEHNSGFISSTKAITQTLLGSPANLIDAKTDLRPDAAYKTMILKNIQPVQSQPMETTYNPMSSSLMWSANNKSANDGRFYNSNSIFDGSPSLGMNRNATGSNSRPKIIDIKTDLRPFGSAKANTCFKELNSSNSHFSPAPGAPVHSVNAMYGHKTNGPDLFYPTGHGGINNFYMNTSSSETRVNSHSTKSAWDSVMPMGNNNASGRMPRWNSYNGAFNSGKENYGGGGSNGLQFKAAIERPTGGRDLRFGVDMSASSFFSSKSGNNSGSGIFNKPTQPKQQHILGQPRHDVFSVCKNLENSFSSTIETSLPGATSTTNSATGTMNSVEVTDPEWLADYKLPVASVFNEMSAESRQNVVSSLPTSVKHKYEYYCWAFKINQLLGERPVLEESMAH